MEKSERLFTKEQMPAIRVGIKKKYVEKYLGKPNPTGAKFKGIFSDIEFNTSRSNYIPLRDSFYLEIDEKIKNFYRAEENEIGVPGTETLMKIFHDENYVPKARLLNGCLLYIDKPPIFTSESVIPASDTSIPPFGLFIDTPNHNEIVPRQLLAKGRVSNANIVWLVVRPVGGVRYWVQPIGKVGADGIWRVPIYIGSVDPGDIGIRSQIRAFVNPSIVLQEGLELFSWPEAQLSTEIIEVVRGTE